MNLPPLIQSFVIHFGEMGSRWGINRTVGQIYALLYLSPRPLNAEEITEALNFSRSNVSMGLKELDSWNLIRHQHLPNDRRDYFSTPRICGRSSAALSRSGANARSNPPSPCCVTSSWRTPPALRRNSLRAGCARCMT